MDIPRTFDGLLAHVTHERSGHSEEYFTSCYVELFKVQGASKLQPLGIITLPLPSGCASFYTVQAFFTDDQYLIVNVQGDIGSSFTGAINPTKAQCHKYRVSDDGDVQLIWHSDETVFHIGSAAHVPPMVTRDGSWAAWMVDSIIDMGTGKVQFQQLFQPPFSSTGSLDYRILHQYWPSPLAGCLTRQLLYFGYYSGYSPNDNPYSPGYHYGWIYEGVDFTGEVLRSANWKDHPQFSQRNFDNFQILRAYRDAHAYVDITSSTGTSGELNLRMEHIDSETYLPTDVAPSVYIRDLLVRQDFAQRLPGSGWEFTNQSDYYVPVTADGSGQLGSSHNPTWFAIPFDFDETGQGVTVASVDANGLICDYSLDFTTRILRRTLYPRWLDADGNIGSYFDQATLQHIPSSGQFALRPILPSDVITGEIDATRRLFLAV